METYRDVTHDPLSASDWKGNVEWAVCLCGFIVDMFSKSVRSKLDDTVWVTKLLYLADRNTWGQKGE